MTPARPDPWRAVTAARLPTESLPALAPVRDRTEVRVSVVGPTAWVCWPAGRADVVRWLLPVSGASFYSRSEGGWVPFGRLVPTSDAPPDGTGLPVAAVLSPCRFEPHAPATPAWAPVALSIARGGLPEAVTAQRCSAHDLLRWADAATTAELAAVRGARAGGRVMLLGARLPPLPTATRFWGNEVLVPLGFNADPDLPEPVLREAVGARAGELLVLDEAGAEVIPLAAFEPLTRAGVRLGVRQS
jgi:hypothetical protein